MGKTTTSINLAAALAAQGRPVLLVDIDPQGNATSGLGGAKLEGGSAYGALLGEELLADKVRATDFSNLYIIPSEVDLCGAEIELPQGADFLMRLRLALEPLREADGYDVVLIDCPPSTGILTLNAFVAADAVLVPLQCEYYALEGMTMIQGLVQKVRGAGNPELELLGILMTMFDGRTRLSQQVLEEVREHFGERVFDTTIPRTTRLAEAPSHGKPVREYAPHNSGAAAYDVLAVELVRRLGLDVETAPEDVVVHQPGAVDGSPLAQEGG